MLQIDDIRFAYPGHEVLKGLSFRLTPGEFVAVLGTNGAGKSTLLRTLAGLLHPSRGTILLNDRALMEYGFGERARLLGYLPQQNTALACTVFDAVLIGRKPHLGQRVSATDLRVVEEVLELLDLREHALRPTIELSGGELQKVAIARALAQQPRLLLLDEPGNHLDIRNQLEVLEHLRQIARQLDITVLAVMHDLNGALRSADRFILLRDGKIHANGGCDIITVENLRAVYHIDALVEEIAGLRVVIPLSPVKPSISHP